MRFVLFSVFLAYVNPYKLSFFPRICSPLFTASTGVLQHIPRLEPGLRLKEPLVDYVMNKISTINALDWLTQSPIVGSEAHGKQYDFFGEFLRITQKNVASYLRKVLATSMIVASSLSSQMTPGLRRAVLAGSAVYTAVGSPKAAFASMFKSYRQLSPVEKLGTTPLFYVCNSQGSPYLQEDLQTGHSEQRIIVYFMSSDDANDYLSEMAQGSPGNVNEFRVMTTSMEKVVHRIQLKKQSRKLGRFPLSTVFRIQPSSRQCDHAAKIQSQAAKERAVSKAKSETPSDLVSVPMFRAKGLVIKRANGEVVSPYYFSLEDLKEDWTKLVTSSGPTSKLPTTPKVEVVDFTEVMCLSADIHSVSITVPKSGGGSKQQQQLELRPLDSSSSAAKSSSSSASLSAACNAGIVPPRREIEMLRKYYRNQAGLKNEFQQARILGLT